MPSHVRSLLGLGLNFCIKPKISSFESFDLKRFSKDFDRKIMFSGAPPDADNPDDEPPALYKPDPTWNPEHLKSLEILRRRCTFEADLRLLFATKRAKNSQSSNLLPFQEAALRWLKEQPDITILSADKNLGPVAMDTTTYINYAFKDHLSDTATYRRLTPEEAAVRMQTIAENINFFLLSFGKGLCKHSYNFIERSTNENLQSPSFMYLLAKIHKSPLKTRAIISYSGSICHGFAKWLSVELKKIIAHMPYVATSSTNVVKDISSRQWPRHTRLFTMDAVSMYTNIHVGHALPVIMNFLRTHEKGRWIQREENINLGRLEFALKLVMENNVFKFGDTFWLQTAGTAMGTPPATDYATLYYAIHEIDVISKFPELRYYCRYIDDGFCVWVRDPNNSLEDDLLRFNEFKVAINSFGINHEFFTNDENTLHPLEWTFSERSHSCIFLDLEIKLFNNNRLATRIYEKKLNLYLYLPAHSCHSPGALKGLIYGFVMRARNLCTEPADRMPYILKCHSRLLARGYLDKVIRPIFNDAIGQVLHGLYNDHQPDRSTDPKDLIYLHLKYNSADPSSNEIQKLFNNTIIEPPNQPHFSEIPTENWYPDSFPDFSRARICYSTQRNLGSILSPRKHRFLDHISVSNIADDLEL